MTARPLLPGAELGPTSVASVVNGVLIHMLGVGLPAALATRAARRPGR